MALTLGLELLFLEVLNTSYIYQITSKVRFVKGLVNSILIYILRLLLHSFTYLFMCFFFPLFMHMLLINCMQSLLFLLHTKMPWWVLFKVFQKYRWSKSFLPWTLFLQSFSGVCVRIGFIVFNKWVWAEWFMTSLICSFVWFCHGLLKG